MRPRSISVTGNGSTRNSTPVPIDWRATPVNLGLMFTTTGNTTNFKVQYTMSPSSDHASASDGNTASVWFDHASMTAMTAAAAGSILFPVTGVRLQANNAGTDTGTLQIITATAP